MNKHRRLNYSLFIMFCFLLAVLSPQNGTVRWLDAQMYRLASHLLPAHPADNDIRAVRLDEAHLQTPQGIRDFRFFLRKLRKAGAAEIVWLSDDFPQMDYLPAEEEAGKDADRAADKATEEGEDETRWEPTRGERNKLAWMLEHQKVFLTQYTSVPQRQHAIPYEQTLVYRQGWRQYIPQVFLPAVQTYRLTDTQLPYRVYPFNPYDSDEQSLVWYDNARESSLPDLALAVYSQLEGNPPLRWSEQGLVDTGTVTLSANGSGKVFNYFSALTGRHADFDVLSLEQAAARPAGFYDGKLVLIGQDDQRLQILADAIASLQKRATYFTPAMSWWLLPLVLSAVAAYLLLILPVMSKYSGLFLGAFLVTGLIAVQPVMLILEGIWWPTINILLLMLAGQLVAYIYVAGKELLDRLITQKQDAWLQLGHYQYEKGDYEQAATSLLKCGADQTALADLYEIGLKFERKRQYDRALQVYSDIQARSRRYRDVDKRIGSLTDVTGQQTLVISAAGQQKTLVLSQMELPEFGRYKIQQELGRGAMGVVYLALDPKINRQVAIKTLDYSQFSGRELETVKSRFFREAEAAGRLCHSNIVTVYDIGEEDDFAFIAMDYVSGVSLSEYTGAENQLPVEEVYRVCQVVAEALDYAHGENIVHRDIKPGNIMYDPDSGQIKITDFDIARITDSVKTRTGSFLGSPSYMAPEQMSGAAVDGHADIYALGVTFYQLLTGQLPFVADTLPNLAYKITNEKFRPVRDIRPELPLSATRIVNKALQKLPEKRYGSGAEMARALASEFSRMTA